MTITTTVKPGKQLVVEMATWQKRKQTTGSTRGKKTCCTDKYFRIIQEEMADTTTFQNIDPSSLITLYMRMSCESRN
jgi:hypothetical protein